MEAFSIKVVTSTPIRIQVGRMSFIFLFFFFAILILYVCVCVCCFACFTFSLTVATREENKIQSVKKKKREQQRAQPLEIDHQLHCSPCNYTKFRLDSCVLSDFYFNSCGVLHRMCDSVVDRTFSRTKDF